MKARRIRPVGFGNVDDHSLTRTSEQNSVPVYAIFMFLRIGARLPSLSVKAPAPPFFAVTKEIFAPADANPVKF